MNTLETNQKRNSEVEVTDEQREFFKESYFNNQYMDSNLTIEQIEELHPVYRFRFYEYLLKLRFITGQVKQSTQQLSQHQKKMMKCELSVIRGELEPFKGVNT